jgi:hypothetical protein
LISINCKCVQISNKGWKEQKQVDNQTTKAMFQRIALLGAYVNIKQWNVNERNL